MNVALIDDTGTVQNIVDIPEEMVLVEPGKFFVPPAGMRAVRLAGDEGAVIGGTYDGERFGPKPSTPEEKIAAMMRDIALLVPDGETAAILQSARREG